VTSVQISSGIPWATVQEEWRTREFGTLRRGVESIGGAALDAVDDLLFGPAPLGSEEPHDLLTTAFADAAAHGDGAVLLLALYVYARSLEKWETSEDYQRIEEVLDGFARAAAALPASATPARSLVADVVRQAHLIEDAMSVEDALSCSCPVAFGARARAIVATLDELLDAKAAPDAALDGVRRLVRADAETARRYFRAIGEIGDVLCAFADQQEPGEVAELARVVAQLDGSLEGDVYESELRAYRAALEALGRAASLPRLNVDEAELVYVYPFALEGVDPGEAVGRALGGATVTPLAERGLAAAPPHALVVNDLWDPYPREGSEQGYSGASIDLPQLNVKTTAHEYIDFPLLEFTSEIRLSRLGNHYLRVVSQLPYGGLHDVNQALRRGSRAMGEEEIRSADETWRRLPDYADDVIAVVAGALGATHVTHPVATFHVVLTARAISVRQRSGENRPAGVADLQEAVGGSLLFHPVRHLATALEEWVRYPPPTVTNLLGQEAYAGDLVARTDNTTIAYMPASPEWLVDEYQEMTEFAASLPPLFTLWAREVVACAAKVDRGLPEGSGAAVDEEELSRLESRILRLEQRIRRELAFLQSPALCRTRGQRRFLDELWTAAGYPELEAELERQLTLLADRHKRIAALRRRWEERQTKRLGEWLELIGVLLAVTSLAGVFQWIDGTFGSQPPHGELWAWVQAAALLATLGLAVTFIAAVRKGWLDRRR
jgi:hypothetical protein